MKRLAVFDFDGTLIDSPEPGNGKQFWQDKMGRQYPYSGWWGRPESLDLDVFEIKPFPSVLNQLKREIVTPNTFVLILTSRMEKLRPQVEAVLEKNNIVVDKVDMKRAEGDKGVKVMRYVQQFPDLEVINVYEDRDTDLEAYERIRSQMPQGIEFNVYHANNGSFALTEVSTKYNLVEMIVEEMQNLNVPVTIRQSLTLYHGADLNNLKTLLWNPEILSPEEKQKLPSNTGGYLIGLSTSTDINNAKKYSQSFGHEKVLKLELTPGAKVFQVDTEGRGIDDMFTGDDLENYQKQGIDAIIETDDGAEKEVRLLNSGHLKVIGIA